MRIAALCLFLLFWVSPAQAEVGDAIDYFNLGLESSLTNNKIKYFTKALELNPKNADAYNSLAWILATSPVDKNRNGKKALSNALKAVILQPDAFKLDTLAASYAEVGKFDDAISTQKKANALFSEDTPVKWYALPREEALKIPGVIKMAKALPPNIPYLRIVEIVGLDKQADGGTHVRKLGEIGQIIRQLPLLLQTVQRQQQAAWRQLQGGGRGGNARERGA